MVSMSRTTLSVRIEPRRAIHLPRFETSKLHARADIRGVIASQFTYRCGRSGARRSSSMSTMGSPSTCRSERRLGCRRELGGFGIPGRHRQGEIHHPTMMTVVVIALISGVICGGICVAIVQRKNLDVPKPFVFGAVLGVIGVLIVLIRKPGLPNAPAGMRTVQCPRCNTVQNIPRDHTQYDCYQCHNSATNATTARR
jgi:hypothetical protein